MAKIGERFFREWMQLGKQEAISAIHDTPIVVPAAEVPKQSFEEALQGQIDQMAARGRKKEGMSR